MHRSKVTRKAVQLIARETVLKQNKWHAASNNQISHGSNRK